MLGLRFSVFSGWIWPEMKIFARDESRPPWVTADPGCRLGLRRHIQGTAWVRRDPRLGLARPTPDLGVCLEFWIPGAFSGFNRFNLLLCSHFNFLHLMRCQDEIRGCKMFFFADGLHGRGSH